MSEKPYDPYAHIRDLQALFRAENEHAIKLAEAGEKLINQNIALRIQLAKHGLKPDA